LAFYWALRNTLVAKDLDQASRIAYGGDKRFSRVVTVDVGRSAAGSGAEARAAAGPGCCAPFGYDQATLRAVAALRRRLLKRQPAAPCPAGQLS
jgi:chromosome segregation ATPase